MGPPLRDSARKSSVGRVANRDHASGNYEPVSAVLPAGIYELVTAVCPAGIRADSSADHFGAHGTFADSAAQSVLIRRTGVPQRVAPLGFALGAAYDGLSPRSGDINP